MSYFTKPGWDRAPTWAKYLAQDGDGSWYWYEERPTASTTGSRVWCRPTTTSRQQRVDSGDDAWMHTLERRP